MRRLIRYFKTRAENQWIGIFVIFFILISCLFYIENVYDVMDLYDDELNALYLMIANAPIIIGIIARLLSNRNVSKWLWTLGFFTIISLLVIRNFL